MQQRRLLYETSSMQHNNYMKFEQLLSLVSDLPLFESGLILAGDVDPDDVRRQLRRGLYSLAPPYQKIAPHPFLVANAFNTRFLCQWAVSAGLLWADSRVCGAYFERNH